MSKLKLKDGTPEGNAHLCRNCTNGQFTVGYRESDVLVICTNSSPGRLVPFHVRECTAFWDRNRPDYEEMTKLALDFSDGKRKPIAGFRNSGFARVPVVVKCDGDDDEDEAAIHQAAVLKP
ncbi:MAG: hypothetical protein ACRD3S_00880 [Terracidiphilus sp.]